MVNLQDKKIRVIDPKINFLSYGPTLKIINEENKKETTLTPDDLVYGAAGVTFKGVNFIDEVIDLKKEDIDFEKKRNNSIIKSAGAGHSSLSTSTGFWVVIEGDSSKLVDSIFTGATYISALMPSGRRIPISKEEIVVPKGIADKGGKSLELYLDASEKNIEAYELLQKNNVPKQEASKIVQYGHSGGGFLYIPLETLVYFSRLAENNKEDIPLEGIEIINQLEKIVHQNGMGVVYESRKNAPRTTNPNPEIFHHRITESEEIFENIKEYTEISPRLLTVFDSSSKLRDRRIENYLKKRSKKNWQESLNELFEIVSDYNNSIKISFITNTPWRVWGEVKRHRTLNQNASSIYNAIEKSLDNYIHDKEISSGFEEEVETLKRFISIPSSVENNKENFEIWEERFFDSLIVYRELLKKGVKESDAISIIPRGIKFPIIKNFDFFNLTLGYNSLRTCRGTVEPEMYFITKKETDLVKRDNRVSESIKKLVVPKCNYVGFCLEGDYKKCCGDVRQVSPNYNEETHKSIWNKRESEIRSKI
ncbi:FAD-dependent thymidylate synthase [Candidatus Woesearchaeota archaeon]|nr:FAD-dependent thymidylate synthase [Candidatus Woesearchaeota archaeon]